MRKPSLNFLQAPAVAPDLDVEVNDSLREIVNLRRLSGNTRFRGTATIEQCVVVSRYQYAENEEKHSNCGNAACDRA